MAIQVLPARLANQIAAGEVVERPASVIKELVENSIDANASQIAIEVERGGHKRILIRDDGSGIAKEELGLALSRHATSKIKDIDDLEAITSLGFRGEALASISSVSRLVLTSMPEGQEQAWQAHCEGREMDIQLNPTAHPKGSSVEVLDLFFNTPARRKFLRAEKTEFQHIEEIVKRIALSHPQIAFTLKHNGKLVHKFSKVDVSLLHRRVAQVCGQTFIDNSIEIDSQFGDVKIKGFCNGIGQGHKTNDMQYSFINGRMMKDRVILHAIRQAFEGMIDPQTYPAFALFIEMPPDQLDVNVHPAKHEVRFHQSRMVHDFIFQSINEALLSASSNTELSSSFALNHGYAQDLSSSSNSFSQHQSEPTRDYVASLQTQSSPSQRVGSGRLSQYMPQRPSIAEKNSYAQLVKPSTEEDPRRIENQYAGLQVMLTPSQQAILCTNNQLKYIELSEIANVFLQKLMDQSSVNQPLLMPVSIASEDMSIAELLANISLEVSAQNKKLILKKVPSTLRQLPWLTIFPKLIEGLESYKISDKIQQGEAALAVIKLKLIFAKVWCECADVSADDLKHWLSHFSEAELNALFEQATLFELPHS